MKTVRSVSAALLLLAAVALAGSFEGMTPSQAKGFGESFDKGGGYSEHVHVAVTPEPGTWGCVGLGIVGLFATRRFRRS